MPAAARVSDLAKGDPHGHTCPACPHPVVGPIIAGSPNVNINSLPAARLGDPGVHAACCGPNMYKTDAGSGSVYINGKAACRKDDATKHCNVGSGKITQGSPNVNIGG